MRIPANHALASTNAAQHATPLIDALIDASKSVRAPFFFPGHKMGRGAPARLFDLGLSRQALRHDLPELPELDNLFAPEGAILRAQELAAAAFESERTWFLVNGSTSGVLAAVTACVQLWRQQRRHGTPLLLVPRNAHKSVYAAMVAAGAEPLWLTPEYDEQSGLCLGVATSTIAAALKRGGQRVAAVLLVSPTYEGVLSDVESASTLCRQQNVPLVVDEAHGAHLQFLTASDDDDDNAMLMPLPRGALLSGADIVVQSTHKTLGSLTQSAMLHASSHALSTYGNRLFTALSSALEMQQSSSPSYLLLASLDAARWQFASPHADGRGKLLRACQYAGWLKDEIGRLPQGAPKLAQLTPGVEGCHAIDPLRITLLAPGGGSLVSSATEDTGANTFSAETEETATAAAARAASARESVAWSWRDGFELDEALIDNSGVYAELPQSHTLTFALSAGTSKRDVRRLARALRDDAGGTRRLRWALPRWSGRAGGGGVGESTMVDAEEASSTAVLPTNLREAAKAANKATTAAGGLAPRDAYFLPQETVDAEAAIGRRSAELICPYPPGIPLLYPGETITRDVYDELNRLREAGCSLTGCSDATLESMTVLEVEAVDDGEALEEEYERVLAAGLPGVSAVALSALSAEF